MSDDTAGHGDRFVVVPAAYLYLLRDAGNGGTQVLLQRRRNTGYMDGRWAAAAAGHVERGETAFDAGRREAAEELGITVVDLSFELTMHRTQGDQPIDERVDFFFSARTWHGEPRLAEPDKADALEWFDLRDLPPSTVPHERVALEHLGSGVGYVALGF